MNVSEEIQRLAKLRDDGVLSEAEFERQKAKLLGSDPRSPNKKSNVKAGLFGCLGLIVLIMVIGAIAGGSGAGNDTSVVTAEQPAAAPPTKVTATELFRAYEANEAAAQKAYGGQRLLVSGTVAGVDLDFSDEPVVQLRTPNEFMSAQAKLTDASKSKAGGLAKGQAVTLECASVSEVMGIPMLEDCDIR